MRSGSRSKPFAKKSLGQNFLIDDHYIRKIIGAVSPSEGDAIVEIGPGRGALTEQLVDSGANVVAIELDHDLSRLLAERFCNSNLRVVEADVLTLDFRSLIDSPHAEDAGRDKKLVANLPYYISTAILQRLADQREVFKELVLMFQKEVVQRVTAEPGDSERGYLTVIVEAAFEVNRLFDIPPEAFLPRPKVWSSVVRLCPKDITLANPDSFRAIVSLGFRQKRKTILNNLRSEISNAAEILERSEIEPTRRAESLTLMEWIRLSDHVVI